MLGEIVKRIKEMKRVLALSEKPTKEETLKTLKICFYGVLLIGLIGFIFYLIFGIIGII